MNRLLVVAALLVVPVCGVAAAPELAVDNPFVIADATGVLLNECGGADAPAEHLRVDQLEARVRALQASTTCAPVASPTPWPQGRSIGVGAHGVSTVADAPKIEHNRVEARRIIVSLGLNVMDLPS